MTRIATLLTLAPIAVGCTASTAPDSLPTSLQVERIWGPIPPLVITVSADTLRIQWWILMNEPCYDFTADALIVPADSLAVILTATRRPGFCQQLETGFAYALAVSRVPSGQVPVRLIYARYGFPSYRELVLDSTVAVP
jgi:hypothetical protein